MPEYIEREEALRQMRESKGDKPKYGDWDMAHACCIDIVEKTPTADVVEVVRCKDCVNLSATAYGYYFCAKWDVDSYEEAIVRFDDFCSYGERKTDEIHQHR